MINPFLKKCIPPIPNVCQRSLPGEKYRICFKMICVIVCPPHPHPHPQRQSKFPSGGNIYKEMFLIIFMILCKK